MSESAVTARDPLPEPLGLLVSAAVDGEARPAELDAVLTAWSGDARVRAAWSQQHRLGELLRSDALGAGGLADEDFLQALRPRLAAEPVPLAPAVWPESAVAAGDLGRESWQERGRRAWGLTGVAVAGLLGVAVLIGQSRWEAGDEHLTELTPKHGVLQLESAALITDQRLDALLQAHQAVSGRRAWTEAGGAVRPADYPPPGVGASAAQPRPRSVITP